MSTSMRMGLILTMAVAGLILSPVDAHAYIGPGVGLTAIGTVLAFLGAIVFAIVGFVWYPIKRLLAMFRSKNASRQD